MKYYLIVQLCLIGAIVKVESARILAVFPTPAISHQKVFRKLTIELVNRGHEVTVITTNPAFPKNEAPPNLTEIDLQDLSYSMKQKVLGEEKYVTYANGFDTTSLSGHFVSTIFEAQIKSLEVQDLITNKSKQFDLLLLEALVPLNIAFSHVFKAPVILVSSFGTMLSNNDVIGIPSHPIFYPSMFITRIYNLSIFEKIYNMYDYIITRYAGYLVRNNDNKMIRKLFGPDVPTLEELYNNVDMFFLNINQIWVDNQPAPPNVVYLGGLHQTESKELPKDLQTFLDSSTNGVIYVSFGSNIYATTVPPKVVVGMTRVLSQLPYNILWKWDKDELPIKTKNIKLVKWLPQADLLKHPNMKLFITQAGLQSTDEAITANVPLIALPMYGDQSYNAEKYVRHGIGIKITVENFDETEFKESVKKVINDKSYRQNIKKLHEVMYDKPESSMERAMWWIDYVLRHKGAKHLRATTANISWMQYYEINTILTVLAFVSAFIFISTVLLKKMFKLLCGNIPIVIKKTKQC